MSFFSELRKEILDDVTVVEDKKIEFRDSGNYIQSNADGKITISSDGGGADDITLSGGVTGDGDWITTGRITKSSDFISTSTYSSDGAIDANDSFVEIDGSSATADLTISAPAAGRFLVLWCSDSSNSTTVTLSSGTYDGTNDVATFDAADEALVLFGVSSTRFLVVENIGSVALSAS